MLEVTQRSDKHCSCHLQGEFVLGVSRKPYTVIPMFSERPNAAHPQKSKFHTEDDFKSRVSLSVSMVSEQGLDDRGSIPERDKGFLPVSASGEAHPASYPTGVLGLKRGRG